MCVGTTLVQASTELCSITNGAGAAHLPVCAYVCEPLFFIPCKAVSHQTACNLVRPES